MNVLFSLVLLVLALAPGVPAQADPADWSLRLRNTLFYTDDVALFSATRRLSLREDPTQPALDTTLTGQGGDMVYEPDVKVRKVFTTPLGRAEAAARAQGFIYAVNPAFNHGSYDFQVSQEFATTLLVRLRYYYAPNQLLGINEQRGAAAPAPAEERVSSQIWSVNLEQRFADDWNVRFLARYGRRFYNHAFAERDNYFWTVGPHVEWRLSSRVELTLGYHYERGLADGRKQPALEDDTSYVNHYFSVEVRANLAKRVSLEMGLHYERNNWTSGLIGDERRGGHEDIFQGEALLVYEPIDRIRLYTGVQRSRRKQSFESDSVGNLNVGAGASVFF